MVDMEGLLVSLAVLVAFFELFGTQKGQLQNIFFDEVFVQKNDRSLNVNR